MNTDSLKILLEQVANISETCNKMAKISGENFNIFKTLNLRSSEVRLHSTFLAEFLNPQGTHGQGALYLNLFVEHLKLFEDQFKHLNFDTNSAIVEVEKHIGRIKDDYTEGGRIDILLKDNKKNRIIIENKIYAKDQKNQLLRYHKFDEQAALLYLSLYKTEITDWSTGGKLNEDQYRIISYHQEIKEWLEKCKKESASLPIIRETLSQYINLIKDLTNQTTGGYYMENEMEKFIIANKEYVDSIDQCSKTLNSIILKTKIKFMELINAKHPTIEIDLNSGISIHCIFGEDKDGLWFGYKVMKGDENISKSEEFQPYRELLKEQMKDGYHSSPNWIGWFCPIPFKDITKFEEYDKKEIISMFTDDSYLSEVANKMIEQDHPIRENLQNEVLK